MMLKNHIGTSANHLGSSWVIFTFPPRAARRLTVTPSQQNFCLHTLISHHHLVLISSLTHQWKALAEICPMVPLPQCAPLTRQLTPRCRIHVMSDPLFCVGAVAPTGTRTTRGAAKMGLRTETLVPPYVINQTLVRGRIWAFQTKS